MAGQICEYCGPVCYRGAEHNARVEDNARFSDEPAAQPEAAPAQVAKYAPCPGDPRGTGFCEFHECERDCPTVVVPTSSSAPQIPAKQSMEEYYREAYRRTLESESRLLAALAAERERTLEKVLSAIERERLEEEPTEEGDKAYNRAIDHAKEAARIALSRTEPEAQP